jgi:hypothetical protein
MPSYAAPQSDDEVSKALPDDATPLLSDAISRPPSAVIVDGVRIAIVVLGVLVALAGLLFALQGFGAVSGSPMTNTTTWSILGPIIALVGLAIAFAGWRARKPR